MALSAFPDPSTPPDADALARTLGTAKPAWDALIASVEAHHPPIDHEWAHAGKSFGWSLRLVRKGRRLVYLTPQDGAFLVGIVLGDAAKAAALGANLPGPLLETLRTARRYAEGTGLRLTVTSLEEVPPIARLVGFKAAG